jgi:hypothetical protein
VLKKALSQQNFTWINVPDPAETVKRKNHVKQCFKSIYPLIFPESMALKDYAKQLVANHGKNITKELLYLGKSESIFGKFELLTVYSHTDPTNLVIFIFQKRLG